MPWSVAWAPTPSNGWLGEVYIGPNSTSRSKADCCKGGTPDNPVSQQCANCVPPVSQLCANGVQPTTSSDTPDSPVHQQCANGEPTVCNQWLVLIASHYVHRTVNNDCPMHTVQSGASSQNGNSVGCPVRQRCANGVQPTASSDS
jgi:hypothetical protein